MLASAPATCRIYVRVNGAQILADHSTLNRNPSNDGFSSAATTSITWSNGASPNQNNIASSSVDTPHVIRVKNQEDSNQTKIKIISPISDGDFCKVMIDSATKSLVVREDDRSSSGASSAPGSDCEKSDSDREAEDGNDSGFCLLRTHSNNSFLTLDNKFPAKPQNNIRLKISSYSQDPKDWEHNINFNDIKLDSPQLCLKSDTNDIHTRIEAVHALLSGSSKLPNKVRSSIVSLVQSAANKNYYYEERGRVVLYTTSVGVVRSTSERCFAIKKILEILMIRFEEKDVFMNKDFQRELKERLGTKHVTLPQVFMEGKHLGGADVIEQLNEIGELRELLRPYKRHSVASPCNLCGGYRFFNCPNCGGSKKSKNIRFALNCVQCNENGLVRCPNCMYGN